MNVCSMRCATFPSVYVRPCIKARRSWLSSAFAAGNRRLPETRPRSPY